MRKRKFSFFEAQFVYRPADVFGKFLGGFANEMSDRKFAAAPELVVEAVFLQKDAPPLLQASLFPVLVPV